MDRPICDEDIENLERDSLTVKVSISAVLDKQRSCIPAGREAKHPPGAYLQSFNPHSNLNMILNGTIYDR